MFKSHTKQQELEKLKIQVDPWDNYLYHDSKFFLEMAFTGNNNNNKNKSKNFFGLDQSFIITQFMIFIHMNDLIGNFRGNGYLIADKLISYLKTQSINDELYFLTKRQLYEKYELEKNEQEKFDGYLESVFSDFILELKKTKNFDDIKLDYFN